ncbi:hypothetical protein JZ751_009192 [Albula glossodonta]|uniref:Uncharacterized protein n=1 Tax=Albula glossodonta TaxID=121402 RepID=A0A8T2N3V3_9TELE|nr:hypothetical protein JZ751_009192 [Albula glossodonta]
MGLAAELGRVGGGVGQAQPDFSETCRPPSTDGTAAASRLVPASLRCPTAGDCCAVCASFIQSEELREGGDLEASTTSHPVGALSNIIHRQCPGKGMWPNTGSVNGKRFTC